MFLAKTEFISNQRNLVSYQSDTQTDIQTPRKHYPSAYTGDNENKLITEIYYVFNFFTN